MKEKSSGIFNIDESGTLTGLCGRLNIPEGVRLTEENCLHDHGFLTEVNIPASCESIRGNFILRCDNVLAFNVAKGNQSFIDEDGVLYTADKKELVRYPAGRACELFRLPDEVESIGAYAFADAKKVSAVLVGGNCRRIKENAFVDTTYSRIKNSEGGGLGGIYERLGIRKYYISPSVKDIGNSIFEGGWEEDGLYYDDIIVGGEIGSVIWEHCNGCNIRFLEVKEEDAEEFLATPYEELLERYKKEAEGPFSFEFTDEGFGGRVEGDRLELFTLDPSRKNLTVCRLDAKLPKNRYEKVKTDKLFPLCLL